MREVKFDTSQQIPEIRIFFNGPRRERTRARLVFDTGSGITQIDVKLLETAGYSVSHAIGTSNVRGATGEPVEGYIIEVPKLYLFGMELHNVPVLAYDFDNFPSVDGLLGFDVIKRLHLEMNGPKGVLKIFEDCIGSVM